MGKIYVNDKVMERYLKTGDIDNSIRTEFYGEIQDKIKENESFKSMSPLNMVMYDAGITKDMEMQTLFNTATYTSGGVQSNEWLFPAWFESTIKEATYGVDVINSIVATTQGIDGNIVRSASINLKDEKNKNAIKKAKVAEGADIPTGKITLGESAITLWKYGRAIEMTYEVARRIKIDLFAKHINAIVTDLARQNVDAAVDVLVNGDGNTGTAATKLGVTSTANTVTSADIIDAMFEYNYVTGLNANVIIASKDMVKKFATMFYDTRLSSGAASNVTFSIPQLDLNNATVIMADVPKISSKDVILLSNRENSLIRYTENGSNIQEAQQFARNQTKLLTVTENSGYAINVIGANMYLEIKSAS